MSEPFRVAFVAGVTPDKWARAWRDRSRVPLELSLVDQAEQETVLRNGDADMCLVRLPVDRTGLHLIKLYDEVPVVVVPLEHPATAYDEIALADLTDEQLVYGEVPEWAPTVAQLEWPAMSAKDAIEVVASGNGIVVVPMSVARLFQRKDVAYRPLTDVAETSIGLAWLIDRDREDTQEFVGCVRGRTTNSSR